MEKILVKIFSFFFFPKKISFIHWILHAHTHTSDENKEIVFKNLVSQQVLKCLPAKQDKT